MMISFLASHGGSSARAIIDAINNGELEAQAGVIVTNNAGSTIAAWCRETDFPVVHISGKTHPDPEQADAALLAALQRAHTDLVVCSGYMKKIGPRTLAAYPGKILNIHPALLPKHGGKGIYGDKVHEAVLKAGDTETGATVHLVTDEYDQGPILKQSHVPVYPGDTVESLRQRVQATEPGLYIESLKSFLSGMAK